MSSKGFSNKSNIVVVFATVEMDRYLQYFPLRNGDMSFSHLEYVKNSLKQAFYMFYIDILICDKNMWEVNLVFSNYTITYSMKAAVKQTLNHFVYVSTSINCRQ